MNGGRNGDMSSGMNSDMTIGAAARDSGVPAKTIRYYEEIGLIAPAARSRGNYRVYGERAVETLRFVQRARGLGFSVKEVAELLALWQDRTRSSAQVKALATRHLKDIDRKIGELEAMRDTLNELVQRCRGDERPDCPILADLSGNGDRTEAATDKQDLST